MVMVDINDEIYNKVKRIFAYNKLDYPSINNFINKVVKEKVEGFKASQSKSVKVI